MNDFLSLSAQAGPDRLALISASERLTYRQLNQRVADCCTRLDAFGLQRGDRVALLLDRSLAAVTLVHACARLGAVIVPINTRLTSAEMQSQVTMAHCRWTITTRDDMPLDDAVRFSDLPPVAASQDWAEGALALDQDFGVLFTSGTTGSPKAALLTWGNIFWSATGSAFRLGVLPDDSWLLTLPLYHIGGLSILLRSALYGTTVALPDFPDDQFNLAQVWSHLHTDQITLVSLVPTMLYRLLREYPQAADWPASLRLVLLGGAAPSAAILEQAQSIDLPVAVTYGLSEAASQVATALPALTRAKPGTSGHPLP